MALTLHASPAAISFSKDPIVFGFTTDALNVSAGVLAVSEVEFTSNMTEGDILALRWAGSEIRFEAKDSPVLANEIPSGTTTLATLLPYFQKNHTIQKEFTVAIASGKLAFTAKSAGTKYNFAEISFEGGTVATSIAGVDPVVRENFGVWLEVTADGSVIYEDIIPVNDLSKAQVDIRQALHAILEPDLPTDLAVVAKCTKSIKDYSIRYAEVFGAKPQIQPITTGSTYKVMLGGTSKRNKLAPLDLKGALVINDPCLRYGSPTRYTATDEQQYLYFSALRIADDFHCTVTVTYTDDTTHSFDTDDVTLALYEKAFFNVSYEALELGDLPKDVASYTVGIFNDTLAQSKSYNFIIDYGYHRYRRHFAYINSLGAVDIFTAYGKQSREMEYFKTKAERVIDETTGQLNQFLDYHIELQENYEVATGFKSKAEIAYLRDFYLSPDKWIVKAAWLPIVVNTTKIKEAKDGNNLYANSFDYAYAFRDDGLSESNIDDDIMPSPPAGFIAGGSVTINNSITAIDFDATPISLSTKAVRSGGIYTALAAKEALLPVGTTAQFLRGDKTLGTIADEVITVGDSRYLKDVDYQADLTETNEALTELDEDIAALTADLSTGYVPKWNGTKFVDFVNFDTSEIEESIEWIWKFPNESSTLTVEETSANEASRTIATREYMASLGTPWYLGGNGLIDGTQKIGFGGVDDEENIFIGDLEIELFGSTVAKFTPEGNAVFGVASVTPLAVGHFHANVSGDTEVALFRASNANVNNYFGVSVDPTVNEVNLRNSGTLHVKNTWDFEAVANFSVSPTTIDAVNPSEIPNLGQINSLITLASDGLKYYNRPINAINNSNEGGLYPYTDSGTFTQGSFTAASGDLVLFINCINTWENGVWEYSGTAWARPTDADSDSEVRGYVYLIEEGSYAGQKWLNTNTSAVTVGFFGDELTYTLFDKERDPVFLAHVASGITSTKISNWDSVYSEWNLFDLNSELTAEWAANNDVTDKFIPEWSDSENGYIDSKIKSFSSTETRCTSDFLALGGDSLGFGKLIDSFNYASILLTSEGSGYSTIMELKLAGAYGQILNNSDNFGSLDIGKASRRWKNLRLNSVNPIEIKGNLAPDGTSAAAKQVYTNNGTNDLFATLDGSYISNWSDKYDAADFSSDWDSKLVDSGIETVLNSDNLTADYLPYWDGSKFVDSILQQYNSNNLIVRGIIQNSETGNSALFGNNAGASQTGSSSYNSAFGNYALRNATSGARNVAVGYESLYQITTGGFNIGVGYGAGSEKSDGGNNIDSSNSIFIGAFTKANSATGSNEIVVGYQAIGKGSNTAKWGNTSMTDHYFNGALHQTSVTDSLLKTDGTGKIVAANYRDLIEEVKLTDSHFERVLHGLYLNKEENNEAFFVGTDMDTGTGIFRSKFWEDELVKVREHLFDPTDSHRLVMIDTDGETKRKYMYYDEFQNWLDNDYVSGSGSTGGGTLQNLTSVLTQGANSSIRASYNNKPYLIADNLAEYATTDTLSSSLANYVLAEDLPSTLGINAVLGIDNRIENQNLEINTWYDGVSDYSQGIVFNARILSGSATPHASLKYNITSAGVAELVLSSVDNLKITALGQFVIDNLDVHADRAAAVEAGKTSGGNILYKTPSGALMLT